MDITWYSILIATLYVLGVFLAVSALWRARTPQGAIAWIIGLVSFPFLTIPLFFVFGRNKFYKDVSMKKVLDEKTQHSISLIQKLYTIQTDMPEHYIELESIIAKSKQVKFTSNNQVDLLTLGEEIYKEILDTISEARNYILFQFYIFNNDKSGQRFKDALIKKAQEGVKIYFMSDYIGSRISNQMTMEMKSAGIEVFEFKSKRVWNRRRQINFRNHKKLVIVDGHTAFVGGCNIGDEYLGLSKLGPWRDTHVKISGPAATVAQVSFVKDWQWVCGKIPHLNWEIEKNISGSTQGASVCMLHTGPADELETCQLMHVSLVRMCKRKLFISTPYFVPSESFVNALILAALRGCEIKIMLPYVNDNRFVKAAEKVYIEKLIPFGIKFYHYQKGFLHQKVMLVDDHTSIIGSANLDARSFFINFEISAIISCKNIASKVEEMLIRDLEDSKAYEQSDLLKRSLLQQVFSRAANLLSPML